MENIERLKLTIPYRKITPDILEAQRRHLELDDWLYKPGRRRYICSMLGTLYKELKDRPDLQDLVLETTFMARKNYGKRWADINWEANDETCYGPCRDPATFDPKSPDWLADQVEPCYGPCRDPATDPQSPAD